METYEEKRKRAAEYHLTSDLFAGKVFEDLNASQELCRKPEGQDVTMRLENGLHEKYYNLEYPTDDMRVNELLRYFRHSDPLYKTKNFPRIVERVRFFKIKKEGVTIMCEIADRIRREGKEERREEGREEGRILGRLEGKEDDILELLEDFGQIPQRIVCRIRQETDMEQLGKWHKCAARVSSIAEFESKM